MNGDDTVDRSSVIRCTSRLSGESGHANIRNFPHSCRQHTRQSPENVQHINNLILADKRMTVKELSLEMEVGEASVCRILKQLQLKNVRDRWVPIMLTYVFP